MSFSFLRSGLPRSLAPALAGGVAAAAAALFDDEIRSAVRPPLVSMAEKLQVSPALAALLPFSGHRVRPSAATCEPAPYVPPTLTHRRDWDASFRGSIKPTEGIMAWAAWCAAFDTVDGDGTITQADIIRHYKRKGASRRLRRKGLSAEHAAAVSEMLMGGDANANGELDFQEFCNVWGRSLSQPLANINRLHSALPFIRLLFSKLVDKSPGKSKGHDDFITTAEFEAFIATAIPNMVGELIPNPSEEDVKRVQAAVNAASLYNAPAFEQFSKGEFGNFDKSNIIKFNEFVTLWYYCVMWTANHSQKCMHTDKTAFESITLKTTANYN